MELKPATCRPITFWNDSFNRTLWNWNFLFICIVKTLSAFNRTLWNWNIEYGTDVKTVDGLLIVPYGIETTERWRNTKWVLLLIVPYGIETRNSDVIECVGHTFNRTLWNWNTGRMSLGARRLTFNRTLWNWNLFINLTLQVLSILLIVPYGIETPQMALPYESASLLLIVPYGIETVFLN